MTSEPKRLQTWIEPAGADWCVTVEIDDCAIFEECYLDEWSARGAADEFEANLMRDLCAEAIERSARICDEVANAEHRTLGERALAKVLAARIRGGER